MIKLRFLEWGDHPRLPGWTLNAVTNVLIREAERASGTSTPAERERERESREGTKLDEDGEGGQELRHAVPPVTKGKQMIPPRPPMPPAPSPPDSWAWAG